MATRNRNGSSGTEPFCAPAALSEGRTNNYLKLRALAWLTRNQAALQSRDC